MAMLPVQAPSEQGSIHQIRPRLTGSPLRGLAGRSDERLVSIAKEGDERAFEILYERHSAAILRYCRSLLRSTQEAEDVKQEVFVLAISALRRGAGPDAFRPWLYRVAHNACMSHLRMRRPVLVADNGVLVGPATAAEPVDGHREELRQLLDDIGQLPDVQRGALLLREMDGFSYEQVGEVLGLPISTVRASIFRARRTLQGLAEARDADCEAIQSELCRLADRRGRRGRHITTHLHVCSSCRDFRDGLRRRPSVLGALTPASPLGPGLLLALKGKLLGSAAGGGVGTVIAGGGGTGAGAAKIVAVAASSIALLAGAGIEADRVIENSGRDAAATTRHVSADRPTPVTALRAPAAPRGAGVAAAAGTGGSAGAVRDGRLVVTGPAAGTRRTPGSRAHARAKGTTGASATPRSHGAAGATTAAAATPSGDVRAPQTAEHEHGGGGSPDRTGDRDGHGRDTRRHEDSSGGRDRSRSGSDTSGSGRDRAEDADEGSAPRSGSSGGSGDARAHGPDDDARASGPSNANGPGTPAPTQTVPTPSPAPNEGTTAPPTTGSPSTPAPAPAPTPAPPTDPAPQTDPPADPQPGDGTITSAPTADPAVTAVEPTL